MRPRVILVNRYFYPDESATSQLAADLAFWLTHQGIEVLAITSRQRLLNAGSSQSARQEIGNLSIVRVWTTRFGRSGLVGRAIDYATFYFSASWHLLRTVSTGDTVVAMTDPPLISIPCALIARIRGARLVNWLQDVFPEVAEQLGVIRGRFLAALLRSWRNASLRAADMNVAICVSMGNRIRSVATGDKVEVIPNWALEEGNVDASPLREKLQLGERFIVGYSGNMGRAHELAHLLDVADVLKEDERVVFLLTGDGAQRRSLEVRAGDLGLRNVIFRPYQPRELLRESLALPDIHVVSLNPTLEGLIMPSKFVGAIALGRPVLWFGDPDGEIGLLVRESGCGVVASVSDTQATAETLRELAADPHRLSRMGEAASGLWATRFRRQIALESWRRVLET